MNIGLLLVLLLVLGAEFTNGLTDAANAIATLIGTRVLSPMKAVIMAAVLNMVGVLVTGIAVATTIGKDIVRPGVITLESLAAVMFTVIVWMIAARFFNIPTSSTYVLLAGLAGAGLATAGYSALLWEGWRKVLMGLVVSTVVGFGLAFIIMIIIYWLFRNARRSTAGHLFQRLQIVSAGFLAFSHGSNDGQKFIGVFTLALVLGGVIPNFHVQTYVIFLCSAVMAVGAGIGGWRVTKTKRLNKVKLESVNAFVAETAASISILASSVFGIPLSTTHTIDTAIMGVGATRRMSAVNWGVSRQIVITWLLTFPACLILGYLFTWLFKLIF